MQPEWMKYADLTEPPEIEKYGFVKTVARGCWGIKVSVNCNNDSNGWHNYTAKLVRLWRNLNP